MVERGEKLCTIRSLAKTVAVPGDTLLHYCGKSLLGTSICTSVLTIDIIQTPRVKAVFLQAGPGSGQRCLGNIEIAVLSVAEGFTDTAAFYAWFAAKASHYQGKLIQWPEIFPF